jgi:hypothetical protein
MTELARIGDAQVGNFTVGKEALRRNTKSYSRRTTSSVSTTISLGATPESHVRPASTGSSSSVRLIRTTDSYSRSANSEATRLVSLNRFLSSEVPNIRSYARNQRTSLELLDYRVNWDDENRNYYTDWVPESAITGREDSLAIRTFVVDSADEPAATIRVEYDGSGNGTVDAESNPVRVPSGETVHAIEHLPVYSGGRYRLVISEYGGYNSIYNIDFGIIH